MSQLQCARCGASIRMTDDHTEIVRRDFVDRPLPSTVEYLCRGCWTVYVEQFLAGDDLE